MKVKNFLRIVIATQIAIIGLVGLSAFGFDIPVIRQIVGFIYLTFIPGLLILSILRLNRLGIIETLLYAVGISIAFLMFLGAFINLLFPLAGIPKPISIIPITGTISFITLVLCLVVYKRESTEKEALFQSCSIPWSDLFSPPALFLFLLPFLSVLGTLLVYLHQGNTILLSLLLLIALIAVLVAFNKFIPAKLYPLAIWAISIALLWHISLVSFHLPGGDVLNEYVFQISILNNSIWKPAISSNLNAMLSITILGPIYSLVLNLSLVWVIKVIYTLLFSLVPLVLYQVYRKQTDDRIAFLGAFFFMSMPVFFTLTPGVRQPIAELFFALTILLSIDHERVSSKKAFLLVLFAFSIVVSHYGLSYIYLLCLFTVFLPFLLFWKSTTVMKWRQRAIIRLRGLGDRTGPFMLEHSPKSTIGINYVVLFAIFCLSWYMYTSSGHSFDSLIRIGDHISNSIYTDLFSLESRDTQLLQALGMAKMRSTETAWTIARYIQYITQVFIIVGVIVLFINIHKSKFRLEYIVMVVASVFILIASIILPYVTTYLNMARVYHIALFFLAPFFILGGIAFFGYLSQILRVLRVNLLQNEITFSSLKIVVVLVLVPYFLFSTGFIFEVTGATPTSVSLSLHNADWPIFTGAEISASSWFLERAVNEKVDCDPISAQLLKYTKLKRIKTEGIYSNIEQIDEGSYLFLRSWNILGKEFLIFRKSGEASKYENINTIRNQGINKIYDTNKAQIWWCSNSR